MIMRHYCWLFAFLSVAAISRSQTQSVKEGAEGHCAIWGQIVTSGRSLKDATSVELVVGNHQPSQKTRVINGNFDFHLVPPGWHQFKIFDQSGRLLYQTTKSLKGGDDQVMIQLPQL